MSYDVVFLHREPGQSWEEALEAQEEADGGCLPTPDMQGQLLAGAQQILAEVDVFTTDEVFEINDEDTRIQLSCYAGEVTIHVPYWYEGDRAGQVTRKMYQLALLVERVTSLEGYDPQLELPVARAWDRVGDATAIFNSVGTMLPAYRRTEE